MKIVHMSVGDPFTARWVNSQAAQGHDVHLVMLGTEWEKLRDDVSKYILPFPKPFGYYLNKSHLKKLLNKINPDLFHVHYASGNGTLGRLSNFHPSILSVWGSDVMVVPHKSKFWHKLVIKNLQAYDVICSTSEVMANHVRSLCDDLPQISLTPIGVNTKIYAPGEKTNEANSMTIGTVKTMDSIYGIDVLIKAFKAVHDRLLLINKDIAEKLRLSIVGGGPQRAELELLSRNIGLSNIIRFQGQVPNQMVPHYLQQMDIFVAMSRIESFGVAVVEASACGLPVVVSNIGGLPEVVEDGVTGFLVESENVSACADALLKLILDKKLRNEMGLAGRKFIEYKYEWDNCLAMMNSVYEQVIEKTRISGLRDRNN